MNYHIPVICTSLFFLRTLFIYVFLAVPGLSLVVENRAYSLASVPELLTAVASLAAEYKL